MNRICVATISLSAALACGRVCAQTWAFTRIADTTTTVPGTTVPFTQFAMPSIDGGVVGFAGFRFSNPQAAGLYTSAGGPLTVVADQQTLAPGGGNFTGFYHPASVWPSLHQGQVAFNGASSTQGGIYVKSGASIVPVVTTLTQIPNTTSTFAGIGSPSLQDGKIAFTGGAQFSGLHDGAYLWQNGSISVVADKFTSIPSGSGTFTGFYESTLDAGQVMFWGAGASGYQGLFLSDPIGTTRLYDTTMVVPGGNGGNFTGLSQSSFGAGRVAFQGFGGGQQGIYSDVSGSLGVIANHNTPVPGRPGQFFGGFGFTDIDNGVVAFMGVFGANTGVFSTHTGVLGKVLAQGDTLDGRTVLDVFMGSQGLSGDSLALYVEFTNGSIGIYRATIPGPGSIGVLGLAGMMASKRRR